MAVYLRLYLRNLANRVGEYFYVAYFIFLNITYIKVFHKSHESTGLSWALGVFCPKTRKKHVSRCFHSYKLFWAFFLLSKYSVKATLSLDYHWNDFYFIPSNLHDLHSNHNSSRCSKLFTTGFFFIFTTSKTLILLYCDLRKSDLQNL